MPARMAPATRRRAARSVLHHRVVASAVLHVPAVSSDPRRPRSGARQRDDAAQARMIVFEFQFAAMQARDGRGEAQAQSRPRFRAALLETHETLHHAAAVGVGNARPAIRHAERDALAVMARFYHDLAPRAVGLADWR